MAIKSLFSPSTLFRDLTSGVVVFLVALPLCLGVALASDAPLFSGLLAGIVGGILVGMLSGSHSSVSGPAAGLTAIVSAQIASLGSFQAFLLAVMFAGVIQIILGVFRAGFIAAFFPSSVIKGLLAAIGVILILKQIPHLLGHDPDPEGEMAFIQPDHENTFSEFLQLFGDIHAGAALIGLFSLALLIFWSKVKSLDKSMIPAPLVVVIVGVAISMFLRTLGEPWAIGSTHLVQVPEADSPAMFFQFLQSPDFSQWSNPNIYMAAVTIAAVASLETLLNLEAIDKLDPHQRNSPPSRELCAQGVGNVVAGLIGGIPVTSVIVRSSVNLNAGGRTKMSTITHGSLLLFCVMLLPTWLNMIPLSCLAAILLFTGFKLASPKLLKQMWNEGRYQFVPFIATLVAIVFTDLLIGILIGLGVSLSFILNSNLRSPIRRRVEKHLGGDVMHIELGNQVSFLNRAALSKVLDDVPRHGHVLFDAHSTDYIDPDVLGLIRDFKEHSGPARGIEVSLQGFRNKYHLQDEIHFVDYSTRDLQQSLTPGQVLQILKAGHERFLAGRRLTREVGRLRYSAAQAQHPMAVVLSCIDSRAPSELVFDVGVGDIFSVRIAGNITSRKILGSIEYACAVAGAKLVVVMGHTQCGAVTAAVDLANVTESNGQPAGCAHLPYVVREIQKSLEPRSGDSLERSAADKDGVVNAVARRNVMHSIQTMIQQSQTLDGLVREGRIAIVGAMYDITSRNIDFLGHGNSSPAENLALDRPGSLVKS